MRNSILLLFLAPFVLGASPAAPPKATPAPAGVAYTVRPLPLPGANDDGILMDYLAFDPHTGFVWAPAGNTGAVDVVDTASGKLTQISGFPTTEVEVRGRKRVIGPSSAAVGDGVVYVGNRGDSTVCAVDARSLARGACGHLDSMPDGLAYVAPTKELWVTTPRDKSVRILDGATLAQKAKLSFDGQPEGLAVDAARGRFYTNLEDKDRTLAIDLESHRTVATWNPKCGEDGPHGLRIDEIGGFLFVACSTRTEALDAGHDGAVLSSVDTGDGVDDLDYAPARRLLYVGAARAGKLTVARVDGRGKLTVVAQVPTREGARNGVVVKDGTVYLAHASAPKSNDLLVVSPRAK
jgi:DNA-binding beta-propeller fold protein YncE